MLSISPIETAVAEVRALDVLDEADVECATLTGAGTSCGRASVRIRRLPSLLACCVPRSPMRLPADREARLSS